MHKNYWVTLTPEERQTLHDLIGAGKGAARRLAHARILLKADQSPNGPAWTDAAIAEAVEVSIPTIERVRRRFVEESFAAALDPRRPEKPRLRKFDGRQEAHLIALACSPPPTGAARWTLQLLADKMVELTYVDSLSYETVRRTLKKTTRSGRWSAWMRPRSNWSVRHAGRCHRAPVRSSAMTSSTSARASATCSCSSSRWPGGAGSRLPTAARASIGRTPSNTWSMSST